MHELLLKYIIFVRMQNGCYLQLTGRPIHEVMCNEGFQRVKYIIHAAAEGQECLQRWRMFYCASFVNTCGLPAKHVLHMLSHRVNQSSISKLVYRVFGRETPNLPSKLINVEPIFAEILRRFRRFKFGRSLERRCPVLISHTDMLKEQNSQKKMPTESAEIYQMHWHTRYDGYASQEDGMAADERPHTISNGAAAVVRPRVSRMGYSAREARRKYLQASSMADLLDMDADYSSVSQDALN